jgi:hypothetical protein
MAKPWPPRQPAIERQTDGGIRLSKRILSSGALAGLARLRDIRRGVQKRAGVSPPFVVELNLYVSEVVGGPAGDGERRETALTRALSADLVQDLTQHNSDVGLLRRI